MDEYGDLSISSEKKNNPELQKGREYIIKRTMYDPFYVKVLDVTETCYRFQYENGNTTWVEKDYYNNTYTFVEDITEFRVQQNLRVFTEQTFESCPTCNGTGQIPDNSVTSGTQTCPLCGGSGQILKTSKYVTD